MSALKRLKISPDPVESSQFSEAQKQTKQVFGFKWKKRETYESENVKESMKRWLFERYCDNNPGKLSEWLSGERKILLDAGCGSGFSALLFFGDHLKNHDYLGVDISDSVDIAKQRFQEEGYQGDFLKMNLMDLPVPESSVDMIFSEGVLHHTDSTEKSLNFLSKKLKPGGRFLFYVYKKKGPVREFTDDFIRNYLKDFDDQKTWEELIPLTKLGEALGRLNIKVDVPEAIPFLDIPAGSIDIQRLFYWHFCKAFYNPDWSIEEMNHINFDWFRPLNCHRHTPEEIKQWCNEAGLDIENMNIQESGITVVAIKL